MGRKVLMTEGMLKRAINETVKRILREYYEDVKFNAFKNKVNEILEDAKEIWFGWQRQRAGGRPMEEKYSGNLMEWIDYVLKSFDYFEEIKDFVKEGCAGFEEQVDEVFLGIDKYRKRMNTLKKRVG